MNTQYLLCIYFKINFNNFKIFYHYCEFLINNKTSKQVSEY